jgi:FkbM family methyltransferase
VSRLAPGPISRLWFFTVVLAFPLKRRLWRHAPVPVRIAAGGRPRTFWFSDNSELFALSEIFSEGEYAAVDGQNPSSIVDLGANVGQAALWFRSQFPQARMLCVEPDPETFAKLRRNLGADPLVTLHQAAITATDCSVSLARTPDSSWGTRVASPTGADADEVPGLSLQTLLAEHRIENVDVLKVDIEGLEHDALGASPALKRTRFVVGEIHPGLLAVPTDRALEDMRRTGGFDRYQLDGDIFVLSRG